MVDGGDVRDALRRLSGRHPVLAEMKADYGTAWVTMA